MDGKTTHWGQLVCGPPGSGKTTYCAAMHEFLNRAGRPTAIINLDPANENAPYEAAVSLQELITVEDAAEIYGLGPNGGLMYCLEFLEANLDWLEERLRSLPGHYFIFDCPGQAELYTHHESFARIVAALGKRLDLRLCAVHLVDAHYVSDPTKYIAAALMSLTAMIRLELPHINVLSKLDLVAAYGQPAFGLDFYTEAHDLHRLVPLIGDESGLGRARQRAKQKARDEKKRLAAVAAGGEATAAATGGSTAAASRGAADAGGSDSEEDDAGGDDYDEAGDDDGDDDHDDDADADDFDRQARPAPPPAGSGSSASGCRSGGAAVVLSPAAIKRATEARRRAFLARHRRLNAALGAVVEDFSLLAYVPVTVREPESLLRLAKVIDKSNGYVPVHPSSAASASAAGRAAAAAAAAAGAGAGASSGGGGGGGAIPPLSAGLAGRSDGSTPAWMPRGPAFGPSSGSGSAGAVSGGGAVIAADGVTVFDSTSAGAGARRGTGAAGSGSASDAGAAGGTGGSDAIADTPFSEWDFERLSGFEERYLARFGREVEVDYDDLAAGGELDGGAGSGGGGAGDGERKRSSRRKRAVRERTAADAGDEAAAAAAVGSESAAAAAATATSIARSRHLASLAGAAEGAPSASRA